MIDGCSSVSTNGRVSEIVRLTDLSMDGGIVELHASWGIGTFGHNELLNTNLST